mmetsp:Transcript_18672/g.62606  ORF Transcript_18672/g.62606 Transcript_18672/m.62606 type:complete len:145 (-) Transcript_18672:81-515(-)
MGTEDTRRDIFDFLTISEPGDQRLLANKPFYASGARPCAPAMPPSHTAQPLNAPRDPQRDAHSPRHGRAAHGRGGPRRRGRRRRGRGSHGARPRRQPFPEARPAGARRAAACGAHACRERSRERIDLRAHERAAGSAPCPGGHG